MNRRRRHDCPIIVSRAVTVCCYAEAGCRPLEHAFRRTVRTYSRSMNDPLHVVGLCRKILHHRFVVFMLTDIGAGQGVTYRPEERRKSPVIGSAQSSRLVEKTLYAVPPHRGDKPFHEGGIDPVGPLELDIAEHRNDEIDPAHQGIRVDRIRDRTLTHLEVRSCNAQLFRRPRQCPHPVAARKSQRNEMLARTASGAEYQKSRLLGHS